MTILSILKEHWGWVITVASFWTFFFSYGVFYSYGLLYVELQEEFRSTNTETAWVGSLSIAMTGFGSLISSGLMQKFSHRSVAITGVLMLSVAFVSTSLMPTFLPLFITYGLLSGLACNFILLSSMSLIVRYFPEKNASRTTAFAITGTTCGMVAMNPMVNLMISHWGWRNMLRVMGGTVLLIGLPCVSTFTQPLQNHNIDDSDEKKTPKYHLVNEITSSKTMAEVSQIKDELSGNNFSRNHRRTLRKQLEILKFPELWFFTIARVITSTAQSFYYVNFVHFMMLMNDFEKRDAALVMTTIAVAEVVGKLLLAVIGDNFPFPKLHLFNIASLMGICVMGSLFAVEKVWHMYCLAIATGLLMSVFDTMPFSVGVEVFGARRNDEATTVFMIALGVGSLLGALFGTSVDKSGTYDVAIYSCIGIYCAAIILYTSVPIYQKLFATDRYIMNNSMDNLEEKCRNTGHRKLAKEKYMDHSNNDRTTYRFERVTSL